jgi:hypothetical protein
LFGFSPGSDLRGEVDKAFSFLLLFEDISVNWPNCCSQDEAEDCRVDDFAGKKSFPRTNSCRQQITTSSIFSREPVQTMPPLKFQGQGGKSKKKSAPSKKSSKSAPPPTSFKSAEYVQESDKEEPENSEKESESDSDDESLPSNPVDVMITPNGKLQRPTGSSSSSENESESDENGSEADDEEEEEPSVTAKQTAADRDK